MRLPLQLLAVFISLSIVGCDTCGNEISQAVASPSGRLKAIVFNRDCGATTGFSTHVSVLPAADTLANDGGNALILDGQVPLRVQWGGESSLRLTGLGAAEVFKQSSSVAGVSVSYGD